MKSICLILLLAWPAFAKAVPTDSTSRATRSMLVNPFRNIKTSVYFQYGGNKAFGRSYGAGVELRRFTSITSYFFLDLNWNEWRKEEGLHNYFYMDGKYQLTTQTFGSRLGLGFAGNYNVYLGGHYISRAYLREDVMSTLNVDEREYFEGDITPYTTTFIPMVGMNIKFKIWSVFFMEAGMEVWFVTKKIFKDLETNWKAPAAYSPFLSRDKEDKGYIYGAIHVKI